MSMVGSIADPLGQIDSCNRRPQVVRQDMRTRLYTDQPECYPASPCLSHPLHLPPQPSPAPTLNPHFPSLLHPITLTSHHSYIPSLLHPALLSFKAWSFCNNLFRTTSFKTLPKKKTKTLNATMNMGIITLRPVV